MSRPNKKWSNSAWLEALSECDEALLECNKIFVYGSLQSFGYNNLLLRTASFENTATTKDGYVLGNVGFPYAFPSKVVPKDYKHLLFPVKGEVWKVNDPSTLYDVDGLEGHPDWYVRTKVQLSDDTDVWMYLQPYWGEAQRCTACALEEGVWRWQG